MPWSLPFKAIPYKELLKFLWEDGEDGENWEERKEESCLHLSKKMYFLIYFSPKKAFERPTHNSSLISKFYVKKDVYKA